MKAKQLATMGATVAKLTKAHYTLSNSTTTNREQRRMVAKAERKQKETQGAAAIRSGK